MDLPAGLLERLQPASKESRSSSADRPRKHPSTAVHQEINSQKPPSPTAERVQPSTQLQPAKGCRRPLHAAAPLKPLRASLLTGLSVKGVDSEGAMS